jgi:hypothetical protein
MRSQFFPPCLLLYGMGSVIPPALRAGFAALRCCWVKSDLHPASRNFGPLHAYSIPISLPRSAALPGSDGPLIVSHPLTNPNTRKLGRIGAPSIPFT